MTNSTFGGRLRQRDPDAWMWVFSGLLLIGAVLLFDDFGVTWDHTVEHFKRHKGPHTFNFWFGGFKPEDAVFTTGHNPFTFFVYYSLWRGLDALGASLSIVDAYHLFTAIITIVGVIFSYRLARHIMPGWWAFAAVLLLVLMPRWFGHGFVNFKDIPFAVAWLASLDTLICAAREPTLKRVMWHGFALSLLLVVRIGGLMFLPISALGFLVGALQAEQPQWRKRMLYGTAALGVVVVMQYLSYPYLLLNPMDGVVELIRTQQDFTWLGTTLTLGEPVSSNAVPWFYVPVWLTVTTPEVLLLGLGLAVAMAATDRLRPGLPMLVLIVGLLFPLIYVVAVSAPIYDGLRHILFVLPLLVIFAVLGWRLLHERVRVKWIVPGVLGVAAFLAAFQIVQLHPYQMLYFNQLVGGAGAAEGQFTLDYWGVSSKESSEWLTANDDGSKRLCVVAELQHSWRIYLPKWVIEDELTLESCPPWAHYAYSFSRNRWRLQSMKYAKRHPRHWEPVHHIRRGGVTVGTIFKNPNPIPGP